MDFTLTTPAARVYVLIGQENYLLEQVAVTIKRAFRQLHTNECTETILELDTANQWSALQDEANSYSLFTPAILIDARCDKKTLDAAGKTFFTNYLAAINNDCLLIVRAPQLPQKQLQAVINHPAAVVIQLKTPDKKTVSNWITQQLAQHAIRCEGNVAGLIEQYSRGNLLACAQTLEKILLTHDPAQLLSAAQVKQQLAYQAEYQLYELSDACLNGDSYQALIILRRLAENRMEPTLILWALAQEVRHLHQLHTLGHTNFRATLAQLKIWPQRGPLYQTSLQRHTTASLNRLLRYCQQLDNAIKTGQHEQLWRAFELLTLALASGKLCVI